MKTKRFLLGLLSSLLISVGLVGAAERIDPVAAATPATSAIETESAPNCQTPCSLSA